VALHPTFPFFCISLWPFFKAYKIYLLQLLKPMRGPVPTPLKSGSWGSMIQISISITKGIRWQDSVWNKTDQLTFFLIL
jgi:hypothetical protein